MEDTNLKQAAKQPPIEDNSNNNNNNNQEAVTYLRIPDNLAARCQDVHGWHADYTKRAITGYLQFMVLKKRQQLSQRAAADSNKATKKTPVLSVLAPIVVYCVWKLHILDICHYMAACREYCSDGVDTADDTSGMILEHDPEEDDLLRLIDISQDGNDESWASRVCGTYELARQTFPSLKASFFRSGGVWAYQHAPDSLLLADEKNQKKKAKKEGDDDDDAAADDDKYNNDNDNNDNDDENNHTDDDDDKVEGLAASRKRQRRTQASLFEPRTEPLTIFARRYHQPENNTRSRNYSLFSDTYFRILPTTKMSKLFAKYVQHNADRREQMEQQPVQRDDGGVRLRPVVPPMTFLFRNRIIKPKDTAHRLGMVDHDMVVVCQSAVVE